MSGEDKAREFYARELDRIGEKTGAMLWREGPAPHPTSQNDTIIRAMLAFREEGRLAALDEAKADLANERAERELLQDILDSRPAINAGLPESYIRWSQGIYSGEGFRARTTPAKDQK